jgi:hypothetical protein
MSGTSCSEECGFFAAEGKNGMCTLCFKHGSLAALKATQPPVVVDNQAARDAMMVNVVAPLQVDDLSFGILVRAARLLRANKQGRISGEELQTLLGPTVRLNQVQAYALRDAATDKVTSSAANFCYSRVIDRWNLRDSLGSEGAYWEAFRHGFLAAGGEPRQPWPLRAGGP